jgi:lipid-binding SYLF domain-containing protein
MPARRFSRIIALAVCVCLFGTLTLPTAADAKTAREIDASVDAVLNRFMQKVKGSKDFLARAKAVLVFADVYQAGIGVGGEYGEGALRIRGKTVGYYSIAAASIGFQFGAQKKDIILVFLDNKALQDFRAKNGWSVGVDGSVTLVDLGAEASIDSSKISQPIVGFVVGQQGLMYNLTLQGTKISKLNVK